MTCFQSIWIQGDPCGILLASLTAAHDCYCSKERRQWLRPPVLRDGGRAMGFDCLIWWCCGCYLMESSHCDSYSNCPSWGTCPTCQASHFRWHYSYCVTWQGLLGSSSTCRGTDLAQALAAKNFSAFTILVRSRLHHATSSNTLFVDSHGYNCSSWVHWP